MNEEKPVIARVVEADVDSFPFTAAHSVLSVPGDLDRITSIAVTPGLGEDIRVLKAIELWQSDQEFEHLFITGTNVNEKLQPQLTLERLQEAPYFLHRLEGVVTQVEAEHTRAQTDWLVEQLVANNVKNLVLCVSHWHITRAYMTLLKSMLNKDYVIPVIPFVIGTSPSQIIPEINETVQNMSAGEAKRIVKYSSIGQIASSEELSNYLNWLWSSFLR